MPSSQEPPRLIGGRWVKSAPSSRPRSRTGAGADFQQSEFESTGHGLGAVGGVQVCEEGGDVGPHGPLRESLARSIPLSRWTSARLNPRSFRFDFKA